MLVSGRLLSKENVLIFFNDSSIKDVIRTIETRLVLLESQAYDEYESAVEALGQARSSKKGAELLFVYRKSASRHVINAEFDRQAHGRQLAALHALGSIAGATRSGNQVLLDGSAEESLRRLIYENASMSSKLTPSVGSISSCSATGFRSSYCVQLWNVQAYRMLMPLVARPWCLVDICTKQEMINLMTDPHMEKIKLGMDAKYDCCKAIHKALQSAISLDPALTGIASKIEEAQPVAVTAERF